MNKIGLIASLLIVMTSCGKNKVFEKYTDIEQYKWKRDAPVVFDVNISDAPAPYDVILSIRHTSYYAYANLLVGVTFHTPSGETRTSDFNFFIREKGGNFIGEGAGDLWDIDFPLFAPVYLNEKGVYRFEITNLMPYVETDDIMQVGLKVRKSDNK